MTEKEKLLAGLLYLDTDAQLTQERCTAKSLCHRFNQLAPAAEAEKLALLRELLGRTDGAFEIVAPFWCDYGYNITIGKNFYANHNTVILDCAAVTFGDNVLVGPNCGFYTAAHPIDAERRNQRLEYAKAITVGSNVWIGGGVQVMPGVHIGSNVVIGGGSVVVRDIPDNCVAVGNPCRVLRAITEADGNTPLGNLGI